MKTSTILLPSVQFKMSFIWTFVLTILLGFASSTAFGQPCSSCNSCSGTPPAVSNPDLTDPCNGFDIVLVLDESTSIAQINGATQSVRNAVTNFLQSVSCGNLRVRILKFRTEASWMTNSYQSFPDALNSINLNSYDPGQGTGYTNWQSALAAIRGLQDRPEMVLFWTDGLPTAMKGAFTGQSSVTTCNTGGTDQGPYANAVHEANILRTDGTHMFVVAIGSVASTGQNNIVGISGTEEYTSSNQSVLTADWSRTTFNNISEDMQSLAFSLCPSVVCESLEACPMSENSGSIEITMNVGGNLYDWTFTGPGTNLNGTGDNDPTKTFNNLPAGNYTFTLTDVGGCTVSTNCSVTIAEMLTCNATINNNIDCINTTGSVTVQGIGGNGDYRYSTNPNSGFGTTTTFTELSAGSHTFYVRDIHSETPGDYCQSECTITILEDNDPPVCNAGGPYVLNCSNDFSLTLDGSSTTLGTTFQWKDPGGNDIPTDINGDATVSQPGSYTLVVTGPNGCTSECAVTVTRPDELTCDINSNESVSCYGLTDGSAEVTASGGTGPYSYRWVLVSQPGTTLSSDFNLTNVGAGTYSVTITDSYGCTSTCQVTIEQPSDPLSCNIGETQDVGCDGISGVITVSTNGGTAGYEYKLGNGEYQVSNTFSGLSAGNHTVTVKDANGCTSTCDITLSPLSPPQVNIKKEVTSGPVLTGNQLNEYSITYRISVENTSPDCPGTYDLRDTLKYGAGAIIGNVTAAYVAGGDGLNGTLNQSFNGQVGNDLIVANETVDAGNIDNYTVTVTFTVDLEEVTDESANCVLISAEEGTGLLNSAGVSGGVPAQWDDACEEIPNPSVNITKEVTSGPTPTANLNEYTITYQIDVTNTSDDLATYDLSDTLKYGAGAIIGNVTAAYVGGGDGLNATLNAGFNGQTGNYLIVDNETVAVGKKDSYTVTVIFTVDLEKVTDQSANCTLEGGELGTGLLNVAEVSDGVPSQKDEDCEEIPNPSVSITKLVTNGPTPTANVNEYTITYQIDVTNTSDDLATYDLSDTLKYGAGAIIGNVTAAYVAGGDGLNATLNAGFNGQTGNYLIVDNETVGAGNKDSYTVTVIFTVDLEVVTDQSANCTLEGGELGTGLLNVAEVSDGVPSKNDDDCREIPNPSVSITKLVINGPTPTANVNEYTITYQIDVTNTSDDLATYDLSDTLKYGAGAIIGNVTAAYVAGGDGLNGTLNQNFNGQVGNDLIVANETVAAGKKDSYTVTVTFTVDLGEVTDESANCVLISAEEGTGLLNSAGVSGGVPAQWDDDCEEIPNPSVSITKLVTNGPTPTANVNEYTITYQIDVTNTSDDLATYDLSDTLKYGAGAIIGNVTAAYVGGGDGLNGTLNQNFNGQVGNDLVVANETVAAGKKDSYTVTVTFTVDLEEVTDESSNCVLISAEEGTGLLNSAGVSGGVPAQWDDDCEEIPNPSVSITKTVSSGPTPTANVNEYTITYQIDVTNTSDDLATYDLSDTLKYGAGAIIGNVTAAYVGGGDGLNGALNAGFNGQTGNYLIVDNETVAGGATDTYTVTVTFTVDLEVVTDESADCDLEEGELGTGLLNVAEVSDGVPSDNAEDCAEIPNPSVNITKTVTNGPTPTANVNEYTITYQIDVTNTSDDLATYDLSDTLKYGAGAIIGNVTAAYVGGGDGLNATLNPSFNGQTGNYLIVDNETVAAGNKDSYTVTVIFMVDLEEVTDQSANCTLEGGELGTGLLNVAEVSDGVPSDNAEDCAEIPNPSVNITKTVTNGPTPTANLNEYTITYEIEVTNTSDDLATYDLSDTLKYGAGANIGNVTASYVSGDGFSGTDLTGSFYGQSNFVISDDEQVGVDQKDVFQVVVTFTVDLEVVTDESADCDLEEGELGTGLLNVAEVSDGVPSDNAEDCAEIPNPSVNITKTVTNGPTPTANLNEYTITYEIEVTNTSDDLATYDLSDTLKYGAGANIGNVTASYVSGDGFSGTDLTGSFEGQSNFVISDDEQVGVDQKDVFQVVVTFTVDLEEVTEQSANCTLDGGELGTGLLNVAEVSDGVPSDNAEDCAEIPNPSVNITKTVTNGPTPTANLNEYTITYEIEVTNTSDDLATYDLSDTLKYGAGAIIGDVTTAYVAGGDGLIATINQNFNGQTGNYLIVDNETVAGGATDTYTVTVTFTVDLEVVTDESADCELTSGEVGTGLLNVAEVSGGVPSQKDEDCEEIPNPSVDITKTVTNGPTPTSNVNEYTITYQIDVTNTSDDLATYDLSDTLKYGAGAIIGNVTAAYVGGGDGLNATLNAGFNGQTGNYLIVDNETVGAGNKDSYTVTVIFTVNPAEVTEESAECTEYDPAAPGSGLMNVAVVSDGVPMDMDDACEDIPNPSVTIVKTVTDGPTSTGNVNEYTITYEIAVENTSGTLAYYDLSDTLKYGAGANIDLVEVTHDNTGDALSTSLITGFDGHTTGNYQIVDDETVAAGATEIYSVTVTFTVNPAEVTEQSAECTVYDPAAPGSGLLNVAVVSDGVPTDMDDACEDIPNPSVTITKTVTDGPTSTGNVNEYTIAYEIEVNNDSEALAFYDLTDTLKYGAGAIIGNVTAAYVAGGDGLNTTLNAAFTGQTGNYLIVDNETVAAGATDIYTVTVTFTVNPAEVTEQSAECTEYDPTAPGNGLLNVAVVSDGVPTDMDDACEDIPNPSVTIVKTVTDGPTSTGNVNEYTITYEIAVENTSESQAYYDLSDTLKYGAGANIDLVEVTHDNTGDALSTSLITGFDGYTTGNYLIVDDETVAAGATETYSVTVTFTVNPAEVTEQSAECTEYDPAAPGSGLLNVAVVSDGVPTDMDDACEDIPNPSVTITKTVTDGPTSTGNVNEYTITYEIEVNNDSEALAFYDLTDTLKYGAGAIIGNVTAAYVAGGDGLNTTLNPAFTGQTGNYLIVDNETVAAGATDTYTVTVTFTVDLDEVTDQSADCELQEGERGTGLLNVAEVSDGVPSQNDEDCEDIPNPSVTIVKTVTDGPTSTGNVNEYTITYEIEVNNDSEALAFYDLSDTLKYGAGAIIGDVTAAYVAGGDGLNTTLNPGFNGQTGNYLIVDNETVAAGATDTYTVTVTFTVDLDEVTDQSADCELQEGELGTGLLNVAEVSDGVPSDNAEDCEEIPNPSVTITKTVTDGPTSTGNVNEYTITYEIEVNNDSEALAFYDLSDTLKYGTGAIIGDVTAAYVAGGDGLNTTLNAAFTGQTGNYLIVDNETVAAGATDTYSVTVTFTVDVEVVSEASANCVLEEGEFGTGLLNVAEVSDGVPSQSDDVCEDIPNPSVVLVKTVSTGPSLTGNVNEYTITYAVEVSNDSEATAFYDLRDTLRFGEGTTITAVLATYTGGILNGTDHTGDFDGQNDYLLAEEVAIAPGATDVFQIIVTFVVIPEEVTDESSDCILTADEEGSGLLNVSVVSGGVPVQRDTACTNIPLICNTVIVEHVSCNGGIDGIATASAVGGVLPYTYEWSNGEFTATADSLGAGTHTVIIRDAEGNTSTCMVVITEPTAISCSIEVTSPETCNVGKDGVIEITATGGTGSYVYSLDSMTFQTSNVFDTLTAGEYTVFVRDENGCVSTCIVTVGRNPCASVGDYVWEDYNDNGIQDASEQGIENVIVILSDNNDNEVRRDTTDASGQYLFDPVDPGTYIITFELKDGYVFAKKNVGSSTEDSDADRTNGVTESFVLGDNEQRLDIDAGMLVPRVEVTAVPDCIQDAPWLRYEIQRFGLDPNAPLTLSWISMTDNSVITSQVLNNDAGHVLWPGAAVDNNGQGIAWPGWAQNPDGSWYTIPTDLRETVAVEFSINPEVRDTVVYPPSEPFCSANPKAEIGDYVWVDYNGNGLQDEGEPVVPDVKVYLLNELGQVVDSTLTNSEGRYFFYPRLGTFQVRFVIPDGQQTTIPGDLSNDEIDNDGDETGLTRQFSVNPGERNFNYDLGLLCVPVYIVVDPYKEILCSEPIVFDQPEYINLQPGAQVDVSTEYYIGGFSDCRHRRTWRVYNACGDLYTATQIIKVINPELPELRPIHPALEGLADGDSVYFECSKPMFFTTDAFEVVDACSTCPSNYQIRMDDYVVNHFCEDGNAIKEVVCWWYVNDGKGNTVRFTIHIFMVDRMPPEFLSVPVDKSISCDEPVQFGSVAVQDACSDRVSLTHTDTFGISAAGYSTITRIWTATDGCGNSSTASQTLTLDQSGPVFTSVPQDKTIEAGSDIVFDAPVAGSGCGEVTIEQYGEDVVTGDDCGGTTHTRKWTASTEEGLFITTSQTITVKPDTEAPVFARMPGNVVLPCGSELPHFDISVSDNADQGVAISTDVQTVGEGCDQVVTRTWTATDDCGNSTSVSQVIRFSADLDITFTYVPGDITLKIGSDIPEILAVAQSNCTEGEVTISVWDVVSDDVLCGQTVLRHFIAVDGCDNRDTAIQTITLIDESAPQLTQSMTNKNVNWGDSIQFDQPEFTDPVGIASITTRDTSVIGQCEGYYQRTWTAVDSCGNAAEVSQIISILPDVKAPVFTTADSAIFINFNDTIPSFEPQAIDNSGSEVTITMKETSKEGDECRQTTIREWTATDNCGNSSKLRWEIIRGDVTPPEFVEIPEDYTVMCIEDVVFDPMIAIDDHDGEVEATFMYLHREGDCFSGYTMSGIWTAVDKCGNLVQHMQNIFVMGDTLAPMITSVPENITIQCGDEIPEQTVEIAENCRVDTVIVHQDFRPVGDNDCSDGTGYLMVRSWVVVDACGNSDTASQYITVLAEGQSNFITFVEVPGTKVVACADDASFGVPVVESNCDSVTLTAEDFTIGEPCSPEYKMIREWTATDNCGQKVSSYQTIIVRQDTVAPKLSLDRPVKFAGCENTIDTVGFDEPLFWDDCSVELVGVSDTTVLEHPEGDSAQIRTWTYMDPCGNASSISQTLIYGATSSDNYFRSERDTFELSCVSDLNSYVPLVYSCDTVTVSYVDVKSDSTCMNQLSIVRTWTATDTLGNADTLVQLFIVNDTIPPVVVFASDTLHMTSLEYATNGAGSNIVSIMDNCGSALSEVVINTVEEDGEVRHEYEVRVEDACGNLTIGRYVVIIAEKPPVVYLQYLNLDRSVIAEVNDGVAPFDYSWSYLKPANDTWTPAGDNDHLLDLSEMGLIRKVRVKVTDAMNQTTEGELDLHKMRAVYKNVTLHPNPASDWVEVRTEMEDVNRIELYNVWGQRVKVFEMDQMDEKSRIQLDLRDVPQGTYSVRFLNQFTVYTRQLIKVH